MAAELVAGTSQLRLISIYAQRSEQFRTGTAGKSFQVTTQGRAALVICKISNRRPCGNHAKSCIETSKLAQKCLQGRLTYPSFLWTRRVLERLQAIQNQQGSAMRNELRQSFALLPRRSEPWIWVAKPSESRVKKFIGGRSASTRALSVERPAENQLCRTIMLSCHPPEPMVDERRLPDTS